jgi:hypothetical protein
MHASDPDAARRRFMQAAAVLLAAPAAAAPAGAALPRPPAGKSGEFDFLTGEWRISHRRRLPTGAGDWDAFEGEASCWGVLGGRASIEELRIPARDFAGLGIRLLDAGQGVWTDFWVNAKSGALAPPGLTGGFTDGVGTFLAEDQDGEQPILVRGVWDRITADGCRWHQAVSRDGGTTWVPNWFMQWTRIAARPPAPPVATP